MLAPGLSPDARDAALAATPPFVDTERPYPELLAEAGFGDVTERDVTAHYRRIAARWLRNAADLEAELRAALGDRVFEEKREIRRASFELIEAGHEVRRLYTATV